MMTIYKANQEDILLIQKMANAIWKVVYKDIITDDQIQYMLDKVYSKPSLEQQMNNGQQFFIATENHQHLGYAAVAPTKQSDIFKLEKLYVKPAIHKKGIGRKMLQVVELYTKEHHGNTLTVQVNRQNKAV